MKKYLKFEYFYIIIILIWVPLQKFILKIDGAGISVSILTLYLFSILVLKKKFIRIASSKPLIIWGIWVVYAFFNGLIKGNGHDLPTFSFFTLLFVPYIMMVTINILSIYNQKSLLNVLIFGMYLSIVIILLFNSQSSDGDRYGSGMNSNTVGIMSVVLLILLYLKYFRKDISLYFILLLSIIPVITVVVTGSKTAFGGLVMLILSHFIVNRSKNILITISKFSIGILFLLLPLNYIINNTTLGERILTSTDQGEELEIDTGNNFLDKFGDRGIYYYIGWQVFKENPITGIGLNNYKLYTGGEYVLHTEYMIQLTELGLIGFFLFFLFYISIYNKLLKLKNLPNKRKYFEINFAFVIIILTMITATRMYNQWYLFSIVGVVTGNIIKESYLKNRYLKVAKAIIKNTNLLK